MTKLKELREKRAKLITDARERLDQITGNTDESRAAELETQHDAAMAEVDTIEKQIEREERMAALEESVENENREERSRRRPREPGERRPAGDEVEGEERTGEQLQAEYRDAFFALMREGGDIGAVTREERDLLRRGYVENRTQTVGTPAAGGYTVPRTLADKIVEVMKDWGPMYDPGVTDEMVTSSGNPFDIPTNDDTGNTSEALPEGDDITDDGSGDLVFGQVTLGAFVFATPWLKISFELLQDSAFDIEGFIAKKLGERLGRGANGKLTVGIGGATEPRGIVVASTLGKTAAAAAAIAGDELIDLQHSVNAAYRRSPKCRWMFADTTLAAIRKLKDGQGNYLWQMGNVQVGAPDLILGKPYSVNDDVPPIATGNRAVLFGDLSRYTVRKVGSPLIGTVRERFWPKVGMAGLIRYDGDLTDGNAVKHLVLA